VGLDQQARDAEAHSPRGLLGVFDVLVTQARMGNGIRTPAGPKKKEKKHDVSQGWYLVSLNRGIHHAADDVLEDTMRI
jgi:hypothetical protein